MQKVRNSVTRSKEVGVRKVMGSKRSQLIYQFLTETFVVSLAALLIARRFGFWRSNASRIYSRYYNRF
ncbi:ABC transporter permease [Streptomyces sp. NPDC001635]